MRTFFAKVHTSVFMAYHENAFTKEVKELLSVVQKYTKLSNMTDRSPSVLTATKAIFV